MPGRWLCSSWNGFRITAPCESPISTNGSLNRLPRPFPTQQFFSKQSECRNAAAFESTAHGGQWSRPAVVNERAPADDWTMGKTDAQPPPPFLLTAFLQKARRGE